jgi:hypothetical protein
MRRRNSGSSLSAGSIVLMAKIFSTLGYAALPEVEDENDRIAAFNGSHA